MRPRRRRTFSCDVKALLHEAEEGACDWCIAAAMGALPLQAEPGLCLCPALDPHFEVSGSERSHKTRAVAKVAHQLSPTPSSMYRSRHHQTPADVAASTLQDACSSLQLQELRAKHQTSPAHRPSPHRADATHMAHSRASSAADDLVVLSYSNVSTHFKTHKLRSPAMSPVPVSAKILTHATSAACEKEMLTGNSSCSLAASRKSKQNLTCSSGLQHVPTSRST